jgi:hypothetical protein
MNRYIIATVISGEASEVHKELVNLVSTQIKLPKINTPSHITLKDSFYCEETVEVEAVIQQVIEDNADINPSIVLDGIDSFRNEVYFIDAQLNEAAFTIHRELIEGLKAISWLQWDQYDVVDREFHLTITTKANNGNYEKIEQLMSKFNPRFEIRFDNISILKKLEDDKRWIVHRGFEV